MFLAVLLLALAVLLGLVERVSSMVLLGALGGLTVFSYTEASARVDRAAGAVAIGIVAGLSGVATGFGWLEAAALAGAGLAASGLADRMLPLVRLPRWWWIPTVVTVGLLLTPLVLDGGVLGHDESAYALKSKTWLYDTPSSGWGLHRGIGMSLIAAPILAIGGSEPALRVLGLVSLIGLAVATKQLGSRLGTPWVGAVAAVIVIASPPMLRRATEFLSDIPSAALLVAIMVIVWREFMERDLPSYRLLALLPLAWVAFYIRYQSLLSFALIVLTILLLWWRKVIARPGPLLATAGVGLLGLIPHFLSATAQTGSAFGILTYTTTSGGRDFTGDGLLGYVWIFGWAMALFIGPLLGLGAIWWFVISRGDGKSRTLGLFLLLPAAVQVLALGILGEAHARFVFFPFALLTVAGVIGFVEVSRTWSRHTTRAAGATLAALLVGVLAVSVTASRNWVENRSLRNEPLGLSADMIREQAHGDVCGVLTSYTPQITFYSECVTDIFRSTLTAEQAVGRLAGDYQYMLLLEDGKRQPEGNQLDSLVDAAVVGPVLVEGQRDEAELYRFAP